MRCCVLLPAFRFLRLVFVGSTAHAAQLIRFVLWSVCAALVFGLAGCGESSNRNGPPSTDVTPEHPNILLVLVDDLGVNDIASWGDGSAQTPNLDKFSSESVRLRRDYGDSTCSPSRASLLTGQYPARVGFLPIALGLSPDLPTLPGSLKSLGYSTFHVGKWHLGEALEYPEIQPSYHGFDYWMGFLNHFVLQGPDETGKLVSRVPTHINPWLQENGAPPVQRMGYLDDLLVDKAVELIENTGEKPWFINLWLYSPHTPYQPAPQYARRFPDTEEGKYLAVLNQLDDNVARLLAALKQKGVDDDTIVVFASDNGGPNRARNNNLPLQGLKATYTEGGVRTPVMVRWPARFSSRDVVQPTQLVDLFPTLVALAGGTAPAGLSGRNLVSVLAGEGDEGSIEPLDRLFWVADTGRAGSTWAIDDFASGWGYYHGGLADFLVEPLAPAIGSSGVFASGSSVDKREALRQLAEWESSARRVPLKWHEANAQQPAYLSGRDFQRAPAFGPYSIGFALPALAAGQEQTLVDQAGVWRLWVDPTRRLGVRYDGVELLSQPLAMEEGCNSLVVSVEVRPEVRMPIRNEAYSRVSVYLNGARVLDDSTLLKRPASASVFAHPTTIGANTDGSNPLGVQTGEPIVFSKFFTGENQDGYSLQAFTKALCPAPTF
ncbi:probable sulfatase precursor [gamma proteobacterium HdN1]|nr:probable sulfatase precursor [gamma proteobacterium HdN1]